MRRCWSQPRTSSSSLAGLSAPWNSRAGWKGRFRRTSARMHGVIKGDVLLHDASHPSGDRRAAGGGRNCTIPGSCTRCSVRPIRPPNSIRRLRPNGSSCIKRRGEAADAFIADTSSMRYLPAAYYWLGRAQERLGGASAGADSYRKYVEIRKDAEGDPLVADARKRAARADLAGRLEGDADRLAGEPIGACLRRSPAEADTRRCSRASGRSRPVRCCCSMCRHRTSPPRTRSRGCSARARRDSPGSSC